MQELLAHLEWLQNMLENLYMPLADVTDAYYSNLESVAEYNTWKKEIVRNWNDIVITQKNNINNKTTRCKT